MTRRRSAIGGLLLALLAPLAPPGGARAQGVVVATSGNVVSLTRSARPVAVPDGLGWDQADYPIAPTLVEPIGAPRYATAGYDPFASAAYAGALAGAQYYVTTSGSDANNCTAQVTACRSISHAVALGNATAAPFAVHVVNIGTAYLGRTNSQITAAQVPTQDFALIAEGGRTTLGLYDALSWSANGTYPQVSQATRSLALRVADPSRRDRFGAYPEYMQVPTLALCAGAPGTFYSDGTSTYVNPFAGELVSDATARVYLNTDLFKFSYSGGGAVNIFITGSTALDGFDFEGGQGSNITVTGPSAQGTVKKIFAIRQATLGYGGGGSNASGGLSVNRWLGLAYAANSDVRAPWSDAWNFHNTGYSSGSGGAFALTLNVSASDPGHGPGASAWVGAIVGTTLTVTSYSASWPHVGDPITGTGVTAGTTIVAPSGANTWTVSASQTVVSTAMAQAGVTSNNGWTSHEDTVGVDLAGVFAGGKGQTVHIINSARLLAAGTWSGGSLGDIMQGGTFTPAEFRTANSAQMWLDGAQAQPLTSGDTSLLATDTSTIFTRNLGPTRGRQAAVVGSSITAY